MKASLKSVESLCKIYFDIASEAIGEENVRLKRDALLANICTDGKEHKYGIEGLDDTSFCRKCFRDKIDNENISVQVPIIQKGRYKTILIDPPWKYGSWGIGSLKANFNNGKDKIRPLPYKFMAIEEIKKLPILSLADENCELYLWTTQKYLPDAFEIIRHWGLKYCTTLTWAKTPMGKGQGGIYTPTTEFIIHARIGKMPKKERIDTTWWNWKRQNKHSKKPEAFQDIVELVTDEPRLEMFARRYRLGWDVWGNEVESDISL